jgi:chromosome segregation ATPase
MESWLIWAAIFAGGAFGVLLALLIAAERELRRYKEMEAAGDPFSIASAIQEREPMGGSRNESGLADFEKERLQLLAQIAELKDQNEAKQERILKLKSAEGQRLEGVNDRLPELEKRITGLEQERSQLLTQVAELRKEVLIREQRIEGLETAQQRFPEMQKRVGEVEQEKSRLAVQVAELKREAEIRQGRIQRLEGLQQRLSEMERQVMELLNGLRLVLKGEDADVSRRLEANK